MNNAFQSYELKKAPDNRAEFQLLGAEIQKWCNLKKFPISLFLNYNHNKIKEGFNRIQKTDIHTLPYLIGIIKRIQ